jgi:hypothetical protein
MRKSAWTTLDEYLFLEGYIPRFLKQQEVRVVASFLAEVAAAFFLKFPSRREELNSEQWINVSCVPRCPLPSLIPPLSLEDPQLVW